MHHETWYHLSQLLFILCLQDCLKNQQVWRIPECAFMLIYHTNVTGYVWLGLSQNCLNKVCN